MHFDRAVCSRIHWACLLAFKVAFPGSVFINRGNHEDSSYWRLCGPAGFVGEIERNYIRQEADQLIDEFQGLVHCWPLMAIVEQSCVVMRGGFPRHPNAKVE